MSLALFPSVHLQYTSVCHSPLQCVTVHYCMLQYITVCYSTLQYVTPRWASLYVSLSLCPSTAHYCMLQYVTVCYPQVGLAVCLSPSAIYTKSSVNDITLQYVTLHYIYTTVCSSSFNLRYSMLKYIYLHYDTLQCIYIESLSRESVKGRSIYLFAVVETAPIATAYQPLCGRVGRRCVRLFSACLICCRQGLGEGF